MNVHVNQLKLIRHDTIDPHTHNIVSNNDNTILNRPQTEVVDGHPFLHYLDDFEEDLEEAGVVIPETPHQDVIAPPQGVRQQIDQRWVNVDANNIIPGGRIRNRPDYNSIMF